MRARRPRNPSCGWPRDDVQPRPCNERRTMSEPSASLPSRARPGVFAHMRAALWRPAARQKLLAFASLIALLAFFSFASQSFLQVDNLVSILQATAVNGVLAVASTFIIVTGGIDLSVGTLMTFCAVMAGVTLTNMGLPLPVGIVVAIASGALSGFVSGSLIARLKIPPFIAT